MDSQEQQNQKQNGSYNAQNISVLEGLEAVRKRPGMYIGSTGTRGLHHLIYEVVDNSIDEALMGVCDNVQITIHKEGNITIKDNGRGIPIGIHPKFNVSALQIVLTKLHAGGKFDKNSYKVSGGLHGVGVSVVNALSVKLKATIHRDGKIVTQSFSRGDPTTEAEEIGKTEEHGTEITFTPDTDIFETTVFQYDTIRSRIRELALEVNPGFSRPVHMIFAPSFILDWSDPVTMPILQAV